MKVIFLSDAHIKDLNSPGQSLLCSFMDSIKDDTDTIVILGDLFDFWFGLRSVVFYEYLPLLNKLIELKRNGVKIVYIEGNHDFFMGPFFTEILDAEVYPHEAVLTFGGKKIFLAHGDRVNRKDYGYRVLRRFLRSRSFTLIANIASPSILFGLARRFSSVSRNYLGKGHPLKLMLRDFAIEKWKSGYDVVVLGHSHGPEILKGKDGEKLYVNLGDWIENFTYLEYNNGEFNLKRFENPQLKQPL